jgi:ubiquinol-cytochrome c reductase iron-sulfur subunit
MTLLRHQASHKGIRTIMFSVMAFSLAFFRIEAIGATEQPTLDPIFKDVTVNIKKLTDNESPSNRWIVKWGRYAVWIIKRTPTEIKALEKADTSLLGAPGTKYWQSQLERAFDSHPQLPNLLELDQRQLEESPYRSYRKEILVMMPMSPYTGCLLTYLPMDTLHKPSPDWKGGFLDTCSNETYDLAGRIFKNSRRQQFWNLFIPPHQYLDEDTLLIGLGEPPRQISSTNYAPKIDYESMKPIPRLVEAAKRGRIDIVKQLLDDGLNVESYIGPGVTPLLESSTKGHNDIVQLLIEHGASPNRTNNYGFTPLHGAIAGYHLETVNLLASHGADVNRICPTLDCNGTPLNFVIYWISQEEEAIAFVVALLRHGANPHISHQGKNAFDWARHKNYKKILAILEQRVILM